jgi:hypothetical protein
MIAFVHPVSGNPDASRVEIHATQRGPSHRGVVRWLCDIPRWIDEVMAKRIRAIP